MSDDQQPTGRLPAKPGSIFRAGTRRSVGRLAQLGFDPIGELVAKYRKLEAELERQEQIRNGEIVELGASGKARAYRPEIHHEIYNKLLLISKELLRYGYGRVPETQIIEENRTPSFVVNLTAPGQKYIVSAPEVSDVEYVEDDTN